MTNSDSSSGLTKSSIETREIFLHIKKRKWIYFTLIAFTGIFSFYLLKYRLLDYSSTASFFVNEYSIITSTTIELQPLENIIASENFNRVYQMIHSADMQKHLIKKFNLIKHYGIDSTKEFYFQQAIELVRSKIVVKKNPYDAISVTVNDKHRYLSADLANEIVTYIETLNEEFYIKNLESKVRLSQAYVAQMEKDNISKSIGIDSMIRKINQLISTGQHDQRNSYYLLSHQQMLSGLITMFQTSSIDLINSQKLYNLTLQALNFKNFPTITVLQMAMPAARSIVFQAFLYSILVMILITMLIILQTYLVIHFRNYFIFIFTNHKGNE